MRECKKRITLLCENETGFLSAIKQVAEELADAEKNVSVLFGSVEGLLGKILAIPVKTVTVIGEHILNIIGWDSPNHTNGNESQSIWGWNSITQNELDESRKQEIIARYNPQFTDSGQLIWPENTGAPPEELIEALGGTSFLESRMINSPVIVYWPGENGTQIRQVFYSPMPSLKDLWFLNDLRTDKDMIPRPHAFPDILDEIHVISCMDTKI